jgi:hypothetical protein|tara:strand:+ start:414 stop:1019 length:606 start_codon:yes stop_codon:yes gene_type:complete
MSEIIFDSNTTKKTLQDNSKTDGFLESKGITINKPTAGVYVRCKPGSKREDFVIVEIATITDANTQKDTQYILKGKDDETHKKLLHTFRSVRTPAYLVHFQDSGGNEQIWVCKMPGKGKTPMTTHKTSVTCIDAMCAGWRMVYFENLKTGYVCEKPETQDAFEDHDFSDFTQSQIINMAFGDNIVTDTDHDIVKVFKGQKL